MTEPEPIPLIIRTRLAHAALQAIADECGADILHIKGAAVDPSLLPQREDAPPDATPEQRSVPRVSSDADILVRPSQLQTLLTRLATYEWQEETRLHSRGVIEHSVDWWHPQLGAADVHVRFPGIQLRAETAFEHMWQNRSSSSIANVPCWVPSIATQQLILLLHAARNPGSRSGDLSAAWEEVTHAERLSIRQIANILESEVGLAASIGHLDEHADDPEYYLWKLLSTQQGSLPEQLYAVLKASTGHKSRAMTGYNLMRWLAYLVASKPARLASNMGRRPSAAEVIGAYFESLDRQVRYLRRAIHARQS